MPKEIIISQELKIKNLENKIKELEDANLMLQEYFSSTFRPKLQNESSSPFGGDPVFSQVFKFTIDLNLQRLVWLDSRNNIFGFNVTRLFLAGIPLLSSKLFSISDNKRFKEIINQFSENTIQIFQTVLRIKQPIQGFSWVLACFEKLPLYEQPGNYLQIQLIKLEENKETSDLLYEFIKKREKGEQYKKVKSLTGRQREILILLGNGLTSKEIANSLNISFHTVEAHRKSIAKKTQTFKRAALIKLATEVGIIR